MKNWLFWTVVLDETLESPLDCKEIHPVTLKEINPEYSLEGPILKLNLHYFGQLKWRTDLLEKALLLGKIDSRRRIVWQRMRWLDGITNSMDITLPKLQELWRTASPVMLQSMGLQSLAWQSDWTEHSTQQILFVIGMFLQQDWGSLRPQHIFPIKFAPMSRSHCLGFTRHSVSSGCRETSIIGDIKE